MWRLAGRKPAGAVITMRGDADRVLQMLPSVAATIARQLGVAAPQVPSAVGLTADEMVLLGRIPIGFAFDLSDAEVGRISAAAARSPLAAMFLLNTSLAQDERSRASLVRVAMQQAPDNPLLLAQICQGFPGELAQYRTRVMDLGRRWPRNAPLALAAARVVRADTRPELYRSYAEQAVRAAIDSPDTWLTLAYAYKLTGRFVRFDRPYASMSRDEESYTRTAYSRWLQAAVRATGLDAVHAEAWMETATAASFTGDANLADLAMNRALGLDTGDIRIYQWGLQMYQPKWFDRPERLRSVAERAAKAQFATVGYSLYLVDALNESGFRDLARQLTSTIIGRQEAVVRARPEDVTALRTLASAYLRTNRYPDGLKVYRKVAEMKGDDARAQSELGNALHLNSQLEAALTAYRRAIYLAPHDRNAHRRAAGILQALDRKPEAIKELQEVVRIAPRDEQTYEQLAALLLEGGRAPEAITAARAALHITASSSHAHELLGEALLRERQFDASVVELREALRLDPADERANQKLQEALGK
jgi:tetratricopeptide (TPR) repeat protein